MKMISKINGLYKDEEFVFETTLSAEQVKAILESNFQRKLGHELVNVRFGGLMISDNAFEIRTKSELKSSNRPFAKQAFVSGKILSETAGKTKIELIKRQKTVLSWLFLLPFLLPLNLFISGLISPASNGILLGIGAFLLFAVLMLIAYAFVGADVIPELEKDLKLVKK